MPTETKVESGTSQSKRGTSVDLNDIGERVAMSGAGANLMSGAGADLMSESGAGQGCTFEGCIPVCFSSTPNGVTGAVHTCTYIYRGAGVTAGVSIYRGDSQGDRCCTYRGCHSTHSYANPQHLAGGVHTVGAALPAEAVG